MEASVRFQRQGMVMPRVSDTDLGKALGYERARKGIQKLIQQHKATLSEKGPLACRKTMVDLGSGSGRRRRGLQFGHSCPIFPE